MRPRLRGRHFGLADAAVAVAVGAGCGPTLPDVDASMRGDTGTRDDGAAADATTDSTPESGHPPTAFGRVVLTNYAAGLGVAARFTDSQGFWNDPRLTNGHCQYGRSGRCASWTCDPAPAGTVVTTVHAGIITVTNERTGHTAQFMPNAEGQYTASPSTVTAAVGDALTVMAQGGAVPGFTSHLSIAPMVDLLQPSGTNVAFMRATGLSLSWSAGPLQVRLNARTRTSTGDQTIACVFPRMPTSTVVAPDELAPLTCGAPLDMVLYGASADDLVVGNYSVHVEAVAVATGGAMGMCD